MKMRHWTIAACVVALALPVMAFEHQAPPVPPGPQAVVAEGAPGPFTDEAKAAVARFLGLTEDQLATWDQLIADRDAAAQPILERLAEIQQELQDLFGEGDPDPAEVGALVIERHDLLEQLGDVHRTYVEGFVAMLDEDQGAKYGLVRRADQIKPVLPAFRVMRLLPPR